MRVVIAAKNGRNWRMLSDNFARAPYFFVGDVYKNGRFDVFAILKNKKTRQFGNVAYDIVHDLLQYEPEVVIAKKFGPNAVRELNRYGISYSNKINW